MNRLQEVREFELITGSEAYRDQNVPGIRYCEFFDSLKNFVLENSARNDDSDILEFMKPGFKRNIGEYISPSSRKFLCLHIFCRHISLYKSL